MKKSFILCLLACFFLNSFTLTAQLDTIKNLDEDCFNGQNLAREDIENYIFQIRSAEIDSKIGDPKFRDFYVRYLKNNYSVSILDVNTEESSYYHCYFQLMRDSIVSKYGKTFFADAFEQAKMEYVILLKKGEETDKIWSVVDTFLIFPGVYDNVNDFFCKNLN